MHTIISEKRSDFDKIIEHLKSELAGVRTGRANTALVDDIAVEAYGSAQPLKNLASISVADPKTLQIEPWDASVVKDIEKAILESGIGITPNVAGNVIRLVMPAMTEDTRKELTKIVGKRGEEARIAIRNTREDVRKEIDRREKDKEITEDDKRGLQKDLDSLVSEYNDQTASIVKEKEDQITTV